MAGSVVVVRREVVVVVVPVAAESRLFTVSSFSYCFDLDFLSLVLWRFLLPASLEESEEMWLSEVEADEAADEDSYIEGWGCSV